MATKYVRGVDDGNVHLLQLKCTKCKYLFWADIVGLSQEEIMDIGCPKCDLFKVPQKRKIVKVKRKSDIMKRVIRYSRQGRVAGGLRGFK